MTRTNLDHTRRCACAECEAEQRVLDATAAMTLAKEKSTRPPFAETVVGRGGGQAVVDAEWSRREGK